MPTPPLELVPLADGRLLTFNVTDYPALKAHLDAGGTLSLGFKSSVAKPTLPVGHLTKIVGVKPAGQNGTGFGADTQVSGTGIGDANTVRKGLAALTSKADLDEFGFVREEQINTDNLFVLDRNQEISGANRFLGPVTVPNQGSTNNNGNAANTAMVQSAILYSLSYSTAIVYRNGLPPLLWPATPLFNPFEGRVIPHDLLVMHGKVPGNFAMRFGDNYKVSAHNFVADAVFPGARYDNDTEDTISIDVAGITVRNVWYVFHSNMYSTKPLLVTVRNAPYIASVIVYGEIAGIHPDLHRFADCTIGRVGFADGNGTPRQTLVFEDCTFGVGVTSGELVPAHDGNSIKVQYVGCTFRLSGTATVGGGGGFAYCAFENCVVVAADGTRTVLDNRPPGSFGPYITRGANGYVNDADLAPATAADFAALYAGIKPLIEADFVKI